MKVSNFFAANLRVLRDTRPSKDDIARNMGLSSLAKELGCPTPVFENRLEVAYIWQRALIAAQSELSEARENVRRAEEATKFFKQQYKDTMRSLGITVPE